MCAYIGFGSNLGDRENHIHKALDLLGRAPSLEIVRISSLFESEPADGVGGDWFLNGAVKVKTTCEPFQLLNLLQSIEEHCGRDREKRTGPRTIDLDILLYGDRVVREQRLIIPHPQLTVRSFVLVPLLEIEPFLVHPVLKRPLRHLFAEIDNPSDIRPFRTITAGDTLSRGRCV